jgi:serine/threonine protein kinase
VTIIDFNVSKLFSNSVNMRTNTGLYKYRAPEMFNGIAPYGPEVDIWSLGSCLYLISSGREPFCHESE